jgi:hypothetical protein
MSRFTVMLGRQRCGLIVESTHRVASGALQQKSMSQYVHATFPEFRPIVHGAAPRSGAAGYRVRVRAGKEVRRVAVAPLGRQRTTCAAFQTAGVLAAPLATDDEADPGSPYTA